MTTEEMIELCKKMGALPRSAEELPAIEKEQQRRKQEVFDVMEKEGFVMIRVTFDGSGDSGSMEVEEWLHKDHLTNPAGMPEPSKELKDLAESFMNDMVTEDWYNNDGGFGSVVLDTRLGTADLDINIRYTESRNTVRTI